MIKTLKFLAIDRVAHEDRGIIGDRVLHAFREIVLQFGHRGADLVRDVDRVRSREREDSAGDGVVIAQQCAQSVFRRADLHARLHSLGG